MIKRGFKWAIKLFAALVLIGMLAYGGFHLWEYASGGKYIAYLTENSQTIPIDKSFTYDGLGKDVENSQLILVGEAHGFKEPSKFDVEFFKYLHGNYGVRHYFAEFDYVQATLLNDYMTTGNEATLQQVLKKWAVFQGRNNQDYFNKYVELQKYHASLPDEDKFTFLGVDKIQDQSLLLDFVQSISGLTGSEDESVLDLLDELIANTENQDTLFLLSHLKTNVAYVQDKMDREEVMFQNFYSLHKAFGLEGRRVYGFFGMTHVLQYRVNGQDKLASKIRLSDLGLADKILSINFMMNDSYMVMPSGQLPEFMRDAGPYTKMGVSADNMLILYIVGIKDFKRMTPNHHKSLIKMNSDDSPYASSIRLNKTIQLLPLTESFELNDRGKPYVQYTVFVRNSDWAEPMTQ